MINIDKIFLLNYKPLTKRLEYLKQHCINNKIFDKVEIIQDEPSPSDVFLLFNTSYVTIPEISLAYKHYIALNKGKELTSFIILEDDVIFDDDWIEIFNKRIEETPDDWDCIFFGRGLDMKIINTKENLYVYKKNHPATKCTDSMIFTGNAANKILNNLLPIKKPIDHHFNDVFYNCNLNVYWWEPGLCKQGSQNGFYNSAIR